MFDERTAVAEPRVDRLHFLATDVTGSRRQEFTMDGNRTAADIALSVVSAWDLPTNVPWSLRDEKHARMLDQDKKLGDQITPNTELAVIPKSHLG